MYALIPTCKILDDKKHFFLHCQTSSQILHPLINAVKTHYHKFNQLNANCKLESIIDPNEHIWPFVVGYIINPCSCENKVHIS